MAVELAEDVRRKVEEPNFWHLATVNPDGSPQSTVIWAHMRDGRILVNTALGRIKPRNIAHDNRVALSLFYPDNPYANIQIQGRVVETITGEQAERDIDDLSEKYTGQTPYPWRKEGEQRVTFLIEPAHVLHRP
jgi:PPOX class probable F420-dependent enzyme